MAVSDHEMTSDPNPTSLSAQSPGLLAGVVCGIFAVFLLIVLVVVSTVTLLRHRHKKYTIKGNNNTIGLLNAVVYEGNPSLPIVLSATSNKGISILITYKFV